jgi:hypothetical protein
MDEVQSIREIGEISRQREHGSHQSDHMDVMGSEQRNLNIEISSNSETWKGLKELRATYPFDGIISCSRSKDYLI